MYHEPVLLSEAVQLLITDPEGIYLDGTLGGGGHSLAILEKLSGQGRLLGLDLDEQAIATAQIKLKQHTQRMNLVKGNFRDFDVAVKQLNLDKLHGILLDLGVSSHQIDTAERGFSFGESGRLDMRMNSEQALSAYEIVNEYPEAELLRIFREYGEERRSRAVAAAIVKTRKSAPVATTGELKAIISSATPPQMRVKSFARIFQALRIAVNQELENLKICLTKSLDHLRSGGRIVVISYHSLEDRLVKQFFKSQEKPCICPPEAPVCTCGKVAELRTVTRGVVRANEDEIAQNPRSRSAKLRAAERL